MSLVVSQLAKHFGGVRALDGVSFEVQLGECVALIGPNGAGKSTCFGCIAGQTVPTSGSISWMGRSLPNGAPGQRAGVGVGRTFQVAQVFESLSVLQNVELQIQQTRWQSAQLLEKVGLGATAHQSALTLPYGAKKRLELAMALATNPQLLLLDEPAAGLAADERHSLMRLVRELAQSGVAVLYTEHNMDAVFGVADRVIVLIDGQVAANGPPDQVAQHPVVQARYLGKGATTLRSTASAGHAVLQVEPLNAWWGQAQVLFDVSLELKAGQCTLLKGLNGAGKSTLLQSIIGHSQRVHSVIRYQKHSDSPTIELQHLPAHARAQAGLGWVAEDRRLFTALTVAQNLRIAAKGPKVMALEERTLNLFPALKPMLNRAASQMSGGEQQMLAIARTLMTQPTVLLLDEPCEGISPVLIDAIVKALAQLKNEGITLLVAEQHAALAPLADQVVELVSGRVLASAKPADSASIIAP